MQNKKYFIGLDLGTNTIGWACINEDYNLLKYNGRHTWGTRIINDVDTAQNRREKRSARRHYERRRERISLLQHLIGESVISVDEGFFIRLNESFLKNEKDDALTGRKSVHILFDGDYTDKEYYKKYPTIYHLRKALIEEDRAFDIREIYLALHHLIKYRGNFLYEGDITKISSLKDAVVEFFNTLYEDSEDAINPFATHIDRIVSVLEDKQIPKYISKKERESGVNLLTKEEECAKLFDDKTQKDIVKNFVKAVIGYSFDLSTVLNIKLENAKKISFKDGYEDKKDDAYDLIGEDASNMLRALEMCYNTFTFGDLLNGKPYIAHAMCDKFGKHKHDLKILKSVVKQVDVDLGEDGRKYYKQMFEDRHTLKKGQGVIGNYAAYVKNQQSIKHKGNLRHQGVKREEFYTFVKDFLTKAKDSECKNYILSEIEKGTFMPKLNDVSNGAIPHQFNLKEMDRILNNQAKYHPILLQNKDKIESILTFKRPYYVGVLSDKSEFGWTKGLYNTQERIYPWNFFENIKNDEIAEQFINKLAGKCTYFKDEQVLARQSITYQAYACLNEINKLQIKGFSISNELKKYLFCNLVCYKKTVKLKGILAKIKEYDPNLYGDLKEEDIKGLADEKLNNSMSTYIDMKMLQRFPTNFEELLSSPLLNAYDEIANVITVFSDKAIRKSRIEKIAREYNFDITLNQLTSLINKNYTGWGKYSKKFLNGIRDKDSLTILQELYYGKNRKSEGYNINELIFDEALGFKHIIDSENKSVDCEKFNFKDHVDGLYCSPKDKSIIWQAICIVEEIAKALKCPPTDIFIETTREDDQKRKTHSRYKVLNDLYNSLKDDDKKWTSQQAIDKMASIDQNNAKELDNDKLYLYLTQLGKCMYSGEIISLDNLQNYEIDHVIPRSYIKDDSLSNRVLVKRELNQRKSGDLSISADVVDKQIKFWTMLLNKGFINEKKYKALKNGIFKDEQLVGFINRQLVETSQIVKLTRGLLARKYGDEHVRGIKAGLSSQFRHSQMEKGNAGFAKIRGLNDFHHAKDAYLAATLGAFTRYSYPCWGNDISAYKIRQDIQNLAKDGKDHQRRFNALINKRNNIILSALEDGMCDMFVDRETGEILPQRFNNILANMALNDCLVTKKIDERANSEFYNETRRPASDAANKSLIPLRSVNNKPLDTSLYGGYESEKPEYFVVVKYDAIRKGSLVHQYDLINIPVLIAYKERSNKECVLEYLTSLGYNNPVVIKKLYKNQLISIKGQKVFLASCSELNNATQFVVDPKFEKMLYFAEKVVALKRNDGIKDINEIRLNGKIKESLCKIENSGLIDDFIPYYVEKLRMAYGIYASVADRLERHYIEGWNALTFMQKLEFIVELLKLSAAGAPLPSLKKYGLADALGRMNNKTIDCLNTSCYHQSVTGLYYKKVALVEE